MVKGEESPEKKDKQKKNFGRTKGNEPMKH